MLVFGKFAVAIYTKLLLTSCLISVGTFPSGKNSTYLCRMGRRYLKFFQILFNNVEIVRQLQCKVGKDQIRIGGRESLGIFSAVGPKRGRGADFCYFKLRNLGKVGKCVSERKD